jgi:hypothetical protein
MPGKTIKMIPIRIGMVENPRLIPRNKDRETKRPITPMAIKATPRRPTTKEPIKCGAMMRSKPIRLVVIPTDLVYFASEICICTIMSSFYGGK